MLPIYALIVVAACHVQPNFEVQVPQGCEAEIAHYATIEDCNKGVADVRKFFPDIRPYKAWCENRTAPPE